MFIVCWLIAACPGNNYVLHSNAIDFKYSIMFKWIFKSTYILEEYLKKCLILIEV